MGGEQDRHAHKMRALSGVDDETWEQFGAVVEEPWNRSAVIRMFIQWYLRRTDELPERPESR